MTTAWVLIFAIYLSGERGGVAIDHVEFGSKAACEEEEQ